MTMEWILCSVDLPFHGDYCWIYGWVNDEQKHDPFVFEGRFDLQSYDFRGAKLIKGSGWEYDTEHFCYVMLDQITHWMPYFTPEPPKDS